MTVTCILCRLEQRCDDPTRHVCPCGGRCFAWDDIGDKAPVSYSNPNWGARMVGPA